MQRRERTTYNIRLGEDRGERRREPTQFLSRRPTFITFVGCLKREEDTKSHNLLDVIGRNDLFVW